MLTFASSVSLICLKCVFQNSTSTLFQQSSPVLKVMDDVQYVSYYTCMCSILMIPEILNGICYLLLI